MSGADQHVFTTREASAQRKERCDHVDHKAPRGLLLVQYETTKSNGSIGTLAQGWLLVLRPTGMRNTIVVQKTTVVFFKTRIRLGMVSQQHDGRVANVAVVDVVVDAAVGGAVV